jgi:hypothetical protein
MLGFFQNLVGFQPCFFQRPFTALVCSRKNIPWIYGIDQWQTSSLERMLSYWQKERGVDKDVYRPEFIILLKSSVVLAKP